MSEQPDHASNDAEGWPVPSRDVLRELEPPPIVWSEQESGGVPATRRSARA